MTTNADTPFWEIMNENDPRKVTTWTHAGEGRLIISAPSSYGSMARPNQEMIVTVTPYGLSAKVRNRWYGRDETLYFPGEYALDDVARMLSSAFFLDTSRHSRERPLHFLMSDILIESEIWEKRGMLANPRSFPAELITKIPLKVFAKSGIKSYRKWFEAAFRKHAAFLGVDAHRWEKMIAQDAFPARVHSIRGWNRLSYDMLAYVLRYEVWKHPGWGLFLSQHYEFYRPVLSMHHEAWAEADAFFRAVVKFPKNERTKTLFNRIYRAGGTIAPALDLRTMRDLEDYCAMLDERAEFVKFKNNLLQHYRAPSIAAPEGWLWASGTSFWNLGRLYNCCISSGYGYAESLASGRGAVLYRPEFAKGDEGAGALCFYQKNDEGAWCVREIRGWCNSEVDDQYLHEAHVVLAEMNAGNGLKIKIRTKHKRALQLAQ